MDTRAFCTQKDHRTCVCGGLFCVSVTGRDRFWCSGWFTSGIRAGVGVLHLAAQFKQNFIQRVGGLLLQHGGNGGVSFLPQGSAAGSVPLDYSALPETVLVEKGSGASLHTELALPEELEAPVERGQTLGKAAVYQGEALLEEYEVRAATDAPRMTVRDAIGLLWQSLTGAA